MASSESSGWVNSSDDFPRDFQNYLNEEKYICKKESDSWVFKADGQLLTADCEIATKIVEAVECCACVFETTLVQFWKAVKISEGQYLLTTRQQPFTICYDCEGLHGYRQACRNFEYFVDNEAEDEGRLGIPGRVFKYKSTEMTPNVAHYTIQEYPQRGEALHYGIRQLFAFPVFELSNKQCAGVLEFSITTSEINHWWGSRPLSAFSRQFERFGLGPPSEYDISGRIQTSLDLQCLAELDSAIEKICEQPAIRMVQAWEPSKNYKPWFNSDTTNISYLKLLRRVVNSYVYHEFWDPDGALLMSHIREGQGVAGMAFSSRKLSLCTEISQLSIIDYPLKHYAVELGCNGIFAICLQCNYAKHHDLFLEFSFGYCGDVYTQLYQILKQIKEHLPSFKVSSGQELGEELPILLIDSQTSNRHRFIPTLEREHVQEPSSDATITGRNDVVLGQRNNLNSNSQQAGEIKATVRRHRKSGIPISLEDIKQQNGKNLDDAAKSVGVSRSTFKRACREFGISWWQFGKRKRDNPPIICGASVEKVIQGHVPGFAMPSSSKQPQEPPMVPDTSRMQHSIPLETTGNANVKVSASVEEVTQVQVPSFIMPSSSKQLHEPPMALDTSRMQDLMPLENVNNVNIKVVYGDKFAIRFQLSMSSGVEELQHEVVKRLNWVNFETYSIQYKDEDNDWILVGCDDDLCQYISSSTSSGKTTITLYLIKSFNISTLSSSQ